MKIYLASDHAGFELKGKIKRLLEGADYEVEDFGAYQFNPEDDYPDFIHLAARAVASDPENSRAIILGGSGQGEAMAANRYPGVRAAVYYGGSQEIVRLSREHNDANVLSLGARFIAEREVLSVVETWLKLPFSGEERHTRRIKKIEKDI